MATRELEGNALTSDPYLDFQGSNTAADLVIPPSPPPLPARELPSSPSFQAFDAGGVQGPVRPPGTDSLASSIQNLVNTGSAAQKLATLVNPSTGDRKAVAVGSQEAQALFGQGFVLEGAPGASASASATATGGYAQAPGTPSAPGADLGGLRGNAQRLRQALNKSCLTRSQISIKSNQISTF